MRQESIQSKLNKLGFYTTWQYGGYWILRSTKDHNYLLRKTPHSGTGFHPNTVTANSKTELLEETLRLLIIGEIEQ